MKKLIAFLILTSPALAQAQWPSWGNGQDQEVSDGTWTVRKLEWTAQDEQGFSDFVARLGKSKCKTVDECIRDATANPYAATDPKGVKFYSDCADFPYFLRSYYAWKNDLPFGYVSQVRTFDKPVPPAVPPVPGEKPKAPDIRYSDLGNYPVARRTLVPRNGQPMDFFREMSLLQNTISSATLRVGADVQVQVANDFYSPNLSPSSIRPGTVLYDPNGHVALVSEILPDGRISYIDAHPDNTVTRGKFSAKFARSKPGQGAGFKNFRPLRLQGAQRSWWGNEYTGGQLVYLRNEQIADYSDVQYYGNVPDAADWKKGKFVQGDRAFGYHDYVRRVLAVRKVNPIEEFTSALEDLCDDLGERVTAVQTAIDKGIHRQAHPLTLPANLFGAAGDWETYSSPGRDARLRASFSELQKDVRAHYEEWLRNDFGDMEYAGADMKKDLLRAFHKVNLACQVSYKNSAGRPVQLGLELSMKRLFAMSFDPYHCPELRWGASAPNELRTCTDDGDKRRWYEAQQGIRNSTSRDWSAPSDITIDMLESGRYGTKLAPDIDLRQYLQNLPAKGAP